MTDQDPLEYSEYLDLMPAYRLGKLSPVQAHRISRLLAEDPIFRKEAERDSLISSAISHLDAAPMPHGLVERSVQFAVGDLEPAHWFSLDSILLALGVGVAGAGGAHFLTTQLNLFEQLGGWIASLTGMILNGEINTLLGTVALVSVMALVLVGFGAYRLLRTD
jgi:hypothetical protein